MFTSVYRTRVLPAPLQLWHGPFGNPFCDRISRNREGADRPSGLKARVTTMGMDDGGASLQTHTRGGQQPSTASIRFAADESRGHRRFTTLDIAKVQLAVRRTL